MIGIPVGALASGWLVEYGPAPRTLIYVITGTLLAVCAALLALSPETTMQPRRAALASLLPRLQAPAGSRQMLLAAGAAFLATWCLGGLYQAFGPSAAAEHLGTKSPRIAATMFSSVMILNPLGGPISSRLSPKSALQLGMTLFVIALAGILIALRAGAFVPLVLASLVVGLAQGAAATAGLRSLLTGASAEERAGLLATIYLIGYSGAAIPGIVAGKLAGSVNLFSIAAGYAVLATIAAVIAAVTAKNPRQKEETP